MIVQLLHFNAKKLPGRIHSLIRWSKDGGNVLSLTRRKISFQLARVFLIVLIRPKLFRIDIDRYDYLIGMLMSPPDKRKVTSMQSSHRWNESYRLRSEERRVGKRVHGGGRDTRQKREPK